MSGGKSPATRRQQSLRAAEAKAVHLFDEVARRGLVVPGVTELQLNEATRRLARELYGIDTYWHKRIVRSGPNTLCPYADNPPNRAIAPNDIIFFDFGPVLTEWEADVGRTYVLGNDEHMLRLQSDVEACWNLAKAHFDAGPDMTGADLYAFVCALAAQRGWTYGQEHCGHLIGEFPHERIQGEEVRNYIHPDNHDSMRAPDRNERPRDWILEIHFVDTKRKIGAFHEQLLTVA